VSVTTTPILDVGGTGPDGPVRGSGTFIDPLVARLHAQYGVDAAVLRDLAVALLAGFADATVQAFIPILVEKRLVNICRSWA
jgi:hypothetical protein